MAYNPFKKLDELKYAASVGSTAPTGYNPYSQTTQKTTQKTQGPGLGYGGANDVFKTSTPKQQTQSQPSYLQNSQTLADKQKAQANERLGRVKDYQSASYDERNRLLKESIPTLQNQFENTRGYFDKAMVGAQDKANLKKANIEDESGSAMRQNAESLRTGRANISNRFAGLNTSDSYGAGSHMQAQENIQSDFNRLTAENLRNKQNNLATIDQELQAYELEAQNKLDTLKSTLDNTVLQIQSNMRMNDLDKQNAIDSAVADYENELNTIDSGMNDLYKDYQLKLMELEKSGLSQQFMETGQPQNEADFQLMYKNPDEYEKMFGSKQGGSENQSRALDLVNSLVGGNTQAISGAWKTPDWLARTGVVGGAGQAKADWSGIGNLLALAKRGELKGSGTVSDFEAQMLQKAALAGLDPQVQSEEEFMAGLKRLQQDLSSLGGSGSQAPNSNQVAILKQSGFTDQEIQEYLGGR